MVHCSMTTSSSPCSSYPRALAAQVLAIGHPCFAPLRHGLEVLANNPSNQTTTHSDQEAEALQQLNALWSSRPPQTAEGYSWATLERTFCFVSSIPSAALNRGYEWHIATTGEIPTRPHHPHDIFGALCWHAFPFIKSCLNRLHWKNLQGAGTITKLPRSPLRDFFTLFDESGLILAVDEPWEALLRSWLSSHDWYSLFVAHRDIFQQHAWPIMIGHALYEKCMQPYLAITARTLILPIPATHARKLQLKDFAFLDWVDRAGAKILAEGEAGRESEPWASTRLLPLPIMGIPGWHPANESSEFYRNTQVFRPPSAFIRRRADN